MPHRRGPITDFFDPAAIEEYVRCCTIKTISGSCRDDRATATSDFAIDTAGRDRRIDMPAMIVRGARGHAPEHAREFLEIWQRCASRIEYSEAFDCGHDIAEEIPDTLLRRFLDFSA